MIQITCNGAKRAQNPPNGEENFKIQSKSGKRTKVLSKHTTVVSVLYKASIMIFDTAG